jgi:hypothetical protein
MKNRTPSNYRSLLWSLGFLFLFLLQTVRSAGTIFITVQQFSFAPSGANLFVGEDKNKF